MQLGCNFLLHILIFIDPSVLQHYPDRIFKVIIRDQKLWFLKKML